MKKLIFLLTVTFSVMVFSQRVQKRDKQINAGVQFHSGDSNPIYLGLDYGLTNEVTIGAQLSYFSKNFSFGANVNYHFNEIFEIPNNWDLYGGATLEFIPYDNKVNTYFLGQIGGRYYFNDKFGINLEFGGGSVRTGGKIGVSFKL